MTAIITEKIFNLFI